METELVQKQEASKLKKPLLIKIVIILILLLLILFALILYTRDQGEFSPNIQVNGVNLSGLTLEEGKLELEKHMNVQLEKTLEFKILGEEQIKKIMLKELGLSYDLTTALDSAWKIGREGHLFNKALSKLQARTGYTALLNPNWDVQQLKNTLKEAFQSYNLDPKDATFEITEDNRMLIQPEQVGRELNLDSIVEEITKLNLEENNLPMLTIPVKSLIKPEITAAYLDSLKITGLLASYTTSFDSSQINRSENIRLAANALDKKILKPEETFSFNEIVGERTPEAGYKEALVIVGNSFTPGLGGGVCQVSSTLYNAIKQGNLKITERHPHSLPVNYVPKGQDATVAFGTLDLKFQNTSTGYLLIRSYVRENNLTFELYGRKDNE